MFMNLFVCHFYCNIIKIILRVGGRGGGAHFITYKCDDSKESVHGFDADSRSVNRFGY